MNVEAYVDGTSIRPTQARVGEGWHIASFRLPGTINEGDQVNYGGTAFGRRTYTPPSGGFQLAEAVFSTELLSAADYAYVHAYLTCKWLGAPVPLVYVEEGAVFDVTETSWRVTCVQVADDNGISGLAKLRALEISGPADVMFPVVGTYAAVDKETAATPNLTFAGDGEVTVAAGTARGNILDATGTITKSGDGALEVSHLTANVTGLAVTEGAFTLSPLLTAASALHFDATQGVATEDVDDKALVVRWDDVNSGRGSALVPVTDKYKYDSTRTVNRPYLVTNATGALPLVDFGSLADSVHTTGWGAGLNPTQPLAGTRKAFATGNGWRQGFVVWQDDAAAKDLPLVNGEPFVGPCLFGTTYSWRRGTGGGGAHFPLAGTDSADFRQSVFLDGVRIPYAEVKTYGIPDGLHVFDSEPGIVDGLSGVATVGYKPEAAATSYYGGMKFGEMLFFRYQLPLAQRRQIAAALGVKWLGTDAHKLEHGLVSLSVDAGASASFPYADVTVTNLAVAGTVTAKSLTAKNLTVANGTIAAPLTMTDGGQLSVTPVAGSHPCLTAQSASFSGEGVIVLTAAGSGYPAKIIATEDGPETPQYLPWKTTQGMNKIVLVRRSDGYYLDSVAGTVIILR